MSSSSPSLLDMIQESLGKEGIAEISKRIGASESQTASAIGAALPAMLGGLTRQGESSDGLGSLMDMLEKVGGAAGGAKSNQPTKGNSIGDLLGDLSGLLGGGKKEEPRSAPAPFDPSDLLGGLLGGSQGRVEAGVQKAGGLSSAATKSLLALLAPIILGALFKTKQSRGLDRDGLRDLLGEEKATVEKKTGGLIGRMLDQDGDGDFDLTDIAKLAMGQIFGKK